MRILLIVLAGLLHLFSTTSSGVQFGSAIFAAPLHISGEETFARIKVDSIVVTKAERTMRVFNGQKFIKQYKIALGVNSIGHKQFQGDGKTPEGLYYIDGKNPHSDYHKNLGISYPNEADRQYARKFNRSPGGDIKIHGMPNGYDAIDIRNLAKDWTIGCIAVSNREIDELYESVGIGTPILILP